MAVMVVPSTVAVFDTEPVPVVAIIAMLPELQTIAVKTPLASSVTDEARFNPSAAFPVLW